MPMYRSRTEKEKRQISRNLKKFFQTRDHTFALTRLQTIYKDPYNYERKIQQVLKMFSEKREKALPKIREYYIHLKLRNLRPGTIYKELNNLWRIMSQFSLDFHRASKQDIIDLCLMIDNKPISDATKGLLKQTIRSLFKFLGKPWLVGWIKVQLGQREEQFLDLPDIRKIIKNAESLEENVFLSLLWEGGFRISELLTLKKDGIKFEDGTAYLSVKGKTGHKIVPILRKGQLFPLNSCGLLKKWLKINGKGYLWSWKAYNQVEYRFRKLREKTEYKYLHAHSFRKSRATFMDIQGVPFQQICNFGGWEINSKTLNVYILTSGRSLAMALQKWN